MNVFHYPRSQRFRNNRSVTSHNDWTKCGQLVPVSVVGKETLIPVLAVLGHPLFNKVAEA